MQGPPREGRGEAKLRELPQLGSPERISQLNFSYNEIRTLPAHIAAATNLQIIDLSHNKIAKIDQLTRIPSLKFVNLSHNLVSELPNALLALTALENLDLSFNRITLLSNIKVLKRLVEIRTFDKKGFIEINLEGNEVLKKKGCKEVCKKWISPSPEEFKKQSMRELSDGYIHLTKKRNSKSLEIPSKDSSMLLTHRTHLHSHKINDIKPFENKLNKQEERQGSALKGSIQLTEKLSPNFFSSEERSDIKQNGMIVRSEILGGQNFQDLSKVFESTTIQDISNLGEWFCLCIDELNELAQKFELLTSNEDTKGLQTSIKDRIHTQSSLAREIIALCLGLVRETIENKLSKEAQEGCMRQIQGIDGRIKSEHDSILREIGSISEALPIKLYKVWVTLYRRLKTIFYQLPDKISNHRISYARDLQIQELLSISPDKKGKMLLPSHEKRQHTYKNESNQKPSASKDKLDDLLFSRNKSECLLLSDNKGRTNSEKKSPSRIDKEECENCLMLRWLTNKNKDEIAELTERVRSLEAERGEQQELIDNLEKFKEKYLNLAGKQELIIGELEYLNPSTYQGFLLQQAKTIEYMLKTSDLVDFQKLKPKDGDQLQDYSSKQLVRDKELLNTRLTSTNNNARGSGNHNKVSEFSIEGRDTKESTNTVRGSSYFKHKNIITTLNRTGEDPKTQIVDQYLVSEENKPKEQRRQEIVVSQFNSHVNSLENTANKNKNEPHEHSLLSKENKIVPEAKEKRKVTQKSSKMENDIILISEGSDLKNVSLSKLEAIKQSEAVKNSGRHSNKMLQCLKPQQFNLIFHSKLTNAQNAPNLQAERSHSLKEVQRKPSQKHQRMNSDLLEKENRRNDSTHSLRHNKTTERFQEDMPSQAACPPMESSEAENYKKYVKYHLRNNIMEILLKKSNCGMEDRPFHYTKTQKLINKANATHRAHHTDQPLSNRHSDNKTLR